MQGLCIQQVFICMESPHFQVADQSLSLWKDAVMIYLSKRNKDVIWQKLFNIFQENKRAHWNTGIVSLNQEVYNIYQRLDQPYWSKMETEWKENPENINTKTDQNTTTTTGDPKDSNTNSDDTATTTKTTQQNGTTHQNGTINGTCKKSNSSLTDSNAKTNDGNALIEKRRREEAEERV